MISCTNCQAFRLRREYGDRLVDAALFHAHNEMVKTFRGYKKMNELYWFKNRAFAFDANSKLALRKMWAGFLFRLYNISFSWQAMEEHRIWLAERKIRVGEILIMVKVPNTSGCLTWKNWHEIQLDKYIETTGD